MINILFNNSYLTSGIHDGIARYVLQLGNRLAKRNYLNFIQYKQSWHGRSEKSENYSLLEKLGTIAKKYGKNNFSAYFLRKILIDYKFKEFSKKYKLTHIYHEPVFLSGPYHGKIIITLHDLSHLKYPECHPAGRVKLLEKYLLKSIEKSDHIITPSCAIRDEVMKIFNVQPNKITPILLGVEKKFFYTSKQQVVSVCKKYGLQPGKYILSIATLEPRKNLSSLIDAYFKLPDSIRNKIPLVLAGRHALYSSRLQDKISKLQQNHQLICPGYVSENDLPGIYAGAIFFAYPSFYEGFGLPVLEAMASGCPVLTSNSSAMPEVIGNAGIVVNPYHVDDIYNKLTQLLEDENLRDDCCKKGLKRAAMFSWNNTVEKTVGIYKKVLKGSC